MCDTAKLLKILNLTTSDNDGEALNAIRMANRLMKKSGMTWEKVLGGGSTTTSRRSDPPPRGSYPSDFADAARYAADPFYTKKKKSHFDDLYDDLFKSAFDEFTMKNTMAFEADRRRAHIVMNGISRRDMAAMLMEHGDRQERAYGKIAELLREDDKLSWQKIEDMYFNILKRRGEFK